MYTIGEVAKMFSLPISTLRYYDNEGLFPSLQREGGKRRFLENDIEALRVIECLKKSGLEIKDIKLFMGWCKEGPSSYHKRLDLIERQKEKIEKEIESFNKALDMLKYKCWYYSIALEDGNEDRAKRLTPSSLPDDIREAYLSAHDDLSRL